MKTVSVRGKKVGLLVVQTFFDIAPTADGGFIMVGFNDFGIHVIKMDKDGNATEVWRELLEKR